MFLNKKSAVSTHGKSQRSCEYRDLIGIYIGFLQNISKFPKQRTSTTYCIPNLARLVELDF